MDTSAAEVSLEDSSEQAKNDQEETVSMDTSELDSKENSLSVSLFVHTDDIQDDLDDDLKEAAAAAAAAAAKEKEMKEEKAAEGKQKSFSNFCGCYAAQVPEQTEGVTSECEGNHDNPVSSNHQEASHFKPHDQWKVFRYLPRATKREGGDGSKNGMTQAKTTNDLTSEWAL